jgi:hypothetical protein
MILEGSQSERFVAAQFREEDLLRLLLVVESHEKTPRVWERRVVVQRPDPTNI